MTKLQRQSRFISDTKDGQEQKAESGQIGVPGRNTGGRNSPMEKSCLLSHSGLYFRTKLLFSSVRSRSAQTQMTIRMKSYARGAGGRLAQLSQEGPDGSSKVRFQEQASSHPSIIHAEVFEM